MVDYNNFKFILMAHTGGVGRANFLQQGIIKAIEKASKLDILSDGGVKHIFGDLLEDHVIRGKLKNEPTSKH